jgi:hypothetical protein
VGSLARVYEIARNAIEYRADHLVRRAAIERMLRRQLVFGGSVESLAEQLLTELKWAMYVTEIEEEKVSKSEIRKALERYWTSLDKASVNRDWLIGMMSAEIEDLLNPNNDYHRFTTFAFHYFKKRVLLDQGEDIDLELFVAIDKSYSLSDDQQISYHLYKLIRGQAKTDEKSEEQLLEETWKHFHRAVTSTYLNRLIAWVRRQMGPMVLLRDMYFANPTNFAYLLNNREDFFKEAAIVLEGQMLLMGKRISTATFRSLMYVFLTKMLVILLVEIPLEKALTGEMHYLTLALNVAIPVAVMWLMTATIKLPSDREQQNLLEKAWQITADFDSPPPHGEVLNSIKDMSRVKFVFYYLFYGALFTVTFAALVFALNWLKFNHVSIVVFLFFLSVVSFFAYRIRQTAHLYTYKPRGNKTSLGEAIMLPVVIVGGILSSGVAKMNFLVFIMDFVLEAPFKIILRFMDNWLSFLSAKKDEVVG